MFTKIAKLKSACVILMHMLIFLMNWFKVTITTKHIFKQFSCSQFYDCSSSPDAQCIQCSQSPCIVVTAVT